MELHHLSCSFKYSCTWDSDPDCEKWDSLSVFKLRFSWKPRCVRKIINRCYASRWRIVDYFFILVESECVDCSLILWNVNFQYFLVDLQAVSMFNRYLFYAMYYCEQPFLLLFVHNCNIFLLCSLCSVHSILMFSFVLSSCTFFTVVFFVKRGGVRSLVGMITFCSD